jgi:hypothetical protein
LGRLGGLMRKLGRVDPFIKMLLGFSPMTKNSVVRREWSKRVKNVCKPCWEIKYCPYGPLVEKFPPVLPTRSEAIEHNEFLKKQIAAGVYDENRKRHFKQQVKTFDPNIYPVKDNQPDKEKACSVFGHMCPVYFVNEPFTETKERRRITRNIPREIMLRVVRRDNNQCQVCSRVLRDDEIEFDHNIPRGKGGATEEYNLRVTCFDCNRKKSKKYKP